MTEEPVDLTIEILKDIRGELRGLRGEVIDLRGEVVDLRKDTNERFERLTDRVDHVTGAVVETNRRLESVERETLKGFTGVHRRLEKMDDRLENIRDFAGDKWREHEERIARLEHPEAPPR